LTRYKLGRRDEALEAVTEAVNTFRVLVEQNPAAYARDYLRSLRNQVDRLDDIGDTEQDVRIAWGLGSAWL